MGNQSQGADTPLDSGSTHGSPPATTTTTAPVSISPVAPPAASSVPEPGAPPATAPAIAESPPGAAPVTAAPAAPATSEKKEDRENTPPVNLDAYKLVLSARAERVDVAFNETRKNYLSIAEINAPLFSDEKRAPVDIVCVLDTSGSMAGTRCSLLRKTIRRLVRGVQAKDRVAIIEFNSNVKVLLPFTSMDAEAKQSCKSVIKALKAGGGTNLSGGLLEALKLVKGRKKEEANELCSVLLFTDGEANQGIRNTDKLIKAAENAMGLSPTGTYEKPAEADPTKWTADDVAQWLVSIGLDLTSLLDKIKELKIDGQILMHDLTEEMLEEDLNVGRIHRAKFVREMEKLREGDTGEAEEPAPKDNLSCTINTFGYGSSHNTTLLEKLAEKFDGLYYYVENAEAIKEGFASCLGGLMSTVATGLTLTLTPMNGAKNVKLLSDFDNKQEKKSLVASVGDIQSEEKRNIVFELELPKEKNEKTAVSYVSVKLTYDNAITGKQDILIKPLDVNRGKVTSKRDEVVDVQHNRIVTSRALDEAERLGQQGKMAEARKMLQTTSDMVRRSASTRSPISVGLVKDMNRTMDGYKNQNEYRSWGRNFARQNKSSLRMERSCKVSRISSEQYSTQSHYQNISKISTYDTFQDSCSDDSDAGDPVYNPISRPPRTAPLPRLPNRAPNRDRVLSPLTESKQEELEASTKKKKRWSLRKKKKSKTAPVLSPAPAERSLAVQEPVLLVPDDATRPANSQYQDFSALALQAPTNSLPPVDFSNAGPTNSLPPADLGPIQQVSNISNASQYQAFSPILLNATASVPSSPEINVSASSPADTAAPGAAADAVDLDQLLVAQPEGQAPQAQPGAPALASPPSPPTP